MFKKKSKSKQKPNRGAKHVEEVLFQASASARVNMRILDHEVQNDGSEDVIAMRIEGVLRPLAQLARSTGYISEAAQIESAAKDIGKDVSSRYGLKPNARQASSGGLADDPVLLHQLVSMAAESDGGEVEDVDVSEEVFEVAREYDAALREALDELVEQYPPENDATAYDLWQAQAPYLVLMTLRGEGVGIWDGDWDRFYEDTKPAEKFLKKKLGKFADDSGAGLLNEAFISSADQEGDSDPDEDEDDEDDDEED